MNLDYSYFINILPLFTIILEENTFTKYNNQNTV
jgi:hypothetical protein